MVLYQHSSRGLCEIIKLRGEERFLDRADLPERVHSRGSQEQRSQEQSRGCHEGRYHGDTIREERSRGLWSNPVSAALLWSNPGDAMRMVELGFRSDNHSIDMQDQLCQ